jgi:hypothetical protein
LQSHFQNVRKNIFFQHIDAISHIAVEYINNINPKRRRSTEWLDDSNYWPPRYGIVTSNASESSNKIYKGARYGTWLNTLDTIWNISGDRISKKYQFAKLRNGVCSNIEKKIKNNWEKAVLYTVYLVEEVTQRYKVTRTLNNTGDAHARHVINMGKNQCTCGKYQDNGYPCVEVCAYYRLCEKKQLDYVMANMVSNYYGMHYQKLLYSKKFNPVIVDTLRADGITKEPKLNKKKQPGCPSKCRLRCHPPNSENSKIITCTRCKHVGHSKRTCEYRQLMSNNEVCEEVHDLSLKRKMGKKEYTRMVTEITKKRK